MFHHDQRIIESVMCILLWSCHCKTSPIVKYALLFIFSLQKIEKYKYIRTTFIFRNEKKIRAHISQSVTFCNDNFIMKRTWLIQWSADHDKTSHGFLINSFLLIRLQKRCWIIALSYQGIMAKRCWRQQRRDSARCISYQQAIQWTELVGSCSRKNWISRQPVVQI